MPSLLLDLWPLYIFLGAILVIVGLTNATYSKRTWSWPTAVAVITNVSKVDEDRPSEPGDSTVLYSMTVHFSYPVGDDTYPGFQTVYSHGHIWHSSKESGLTNKYKLGRSFRIRYRPDKPSEHLPAGPKNPGAGYGTAFFGTAAILSGGLLAVAAGLLWPVAIGLAVAGMIGGAVWTAAYPRADSTDGLSHLF